MRVSVSEQQRNQLNMLASWVNQLPFWASMTTVDVFRRIRAGDLRFETIDDALFKETQRLLTDSLLSLSPRHEPLRQAITQWQIQYEGYHSHCVARERKNNPLLQQALPQLSTQWQDIVRSISAFKTQVISSYKKNDQSVTSQLKQKLGSDFSSAQHLQQALHKNRQQHDVLIFVQPQPWFIQQKNAHPWDDILFLTQLLKPESVIPALQNQNALLELTYAKQRTRLTTVLQQRGLPYYTALIREQRMLSAARQWQTHITTAWPAQWKSLPPLQRSFSIRQVLHHQKISILNAQFSEQKSYVLFNDCYKASLKELQKKHHRILQDTQHRETQLLASDTYWQGLMIHMGLVISQQPAFFFGQLAAKSSFDVLNRYPQLGHATPKYLVDKVAKLNGLSFLLINIALSSWWGSSYQLTHAITQLLFFNETVLSRLGRGIESIAERTMAPVFDRVLAQLPLSYQTPLLHLKQASRCDTLGLAEKASQLLLLMGLITHVLMCTLWTEQDPWVSAMTYLVAMTFAQLVIWVMEQKAVFSNASHPSKALAQATIFSLVYRYSFSSLHGWLKAPPTRSLSQADALQRFGLSGQANATQIRKRFHQLSLQHHPDKCVTLVCRDQASQNMMALTEAYDVLMKPR